MALSSISRFLSLSIRQKTSTNSTLQFTTVSSKYITHLQKNGRNIEKTLSTVRAKLDSSCVNEVLGSCSLNQSLLGLRFFVWAGLQSGYRHSAYTYSRACKLFKIYQNPRSITEVIEAYRTEGCLVNVKTFKVLLNLCKEAKLADEALWVLRKMPEFNCRGDTTLYNVVIRLFCEKGDMEMVDNLMKEMGLVDLFPDMVTCVMVIKAFSDAGQLENAFRSFQVMKDNGCPPNAVAYTTLLDGVCRFGSMERALELLGEMEKEGGDCTPNVVTYTLVIQNFCEKGRSVEALAILDRMEACGFAPNRVTASTLIKGLCTEGRINEAHKMINKVVAGGSVSNGECYSSLVMSLLRIGNFEEAEMLFKRMLTNGVKPDGLACSTLIKQLCLKGQVLDGFHLSDEINKMGCLSSMDTDIPSIILVGLCQQNHLIEAAKFARLMLERGIRLKAPYVEDIVEHLKRSGEKELVMHLTRIGR